MSQTPFNFIAHFRAKPGSEQALEDALMACGAPTRAEEGNVNTVKAKKVFIITCKKKHRSA